MIRKSVWLNESHRFSFWLNLIYLPLFSVFIVILYHIVYAMVTNVCQPSMETFIKKATTPWHGIGRVRFEEIKISANKNYISLIT